MSSISMKFVRVIGFGVWSFASMALAVAERLRNQGIGVTVVDPRWVLPVPEALGELARGHKLVVTVEDNGVHGGIGSSVSAALRHAEIDVPCRDLGVPQVFQEHASRGEVLAAVGLTGFAAVVALDAVRTGADVDALGRIEVYLVAVPGVAWFAVLLEMSRPRDCTRGRGREQGGAHFARVAQRRGQRGDPGIGFLCAPLHQQPAEILRRIRGAPGGERAELRRHWLERFLLDEHIEIGEL